MLLNTPSQIRLYGNILNFNQLDKKNKMILKSKPTRVRASAFKGQWKLASVSVF